MRYNFTLPELQGKLDALEAGAAFQISHRDYERLFGQNDLAANRLRIFGTGHRCRVSFSDGAVVFLKEWTGAPESPPI